MAASSGREHSTERMKELDDRRIAPQNVVILGNSRCKTTVPTTSKPLIKFSINVLTRYLLVVCRGLTFR